MLSHRSMFFRRARLLLTLSKLISSLRMSHGLIARSKESDYSLDTSRTLFIRWSKIYPQLCIVWIYSRDLIGRCSMLDSYNISIQQISEFKGFRNSWDIAAMNMSLVLTAISACSISSYCFPIICLRMDSWFLTSNMGNKSTIKS